jgi:hypothetical protein
MYLNKEQPKYWVTLELRVFSTVCTEEDKTKKIVERRKYLAQRKTVVMSIIKKKSCNLI